MEKKIKREKLRPREDGGHKNPTATTSSSPKVLRRSSRIRKLLLKSQPLKPKECNCGTRRSKRILKRMLKVSNQGRLTKIKLSGFCARCGRVAKVLHSYDLRSCMSVKRFKYLKNFNKTSRSKVKKTIKVTLPEGIDVKVVEEPNSGSQSGNFAVDVGDTSHENESAKLNKESAVNVTVVSEGVSNQSDKEPIITKKAPGVPLRNSLSFSYFPSKSPGSLENLATKDGLVGLLPCNDETTFDNHAATPIQSVAPSYVPLNGTERSAVDMSQNSLEDVAPSSSVNAASSSQPGTSDAATPQPEAASVPKRLNLLLDYIPDSYMKVSTRPVQRISILSKSISRILEKQMSAIKRPLIDPCMECPPSKKKVVFEPLRVGPVATLEELDIKVLQFQHKKLKQRLEFRQKQEQDLRERIEQLEKRQTQDDAVLNVINRYWNQLNEDIRILLQRFDPETSDESESKNEREATTSFLTQLSTWDINELDEKLANRVQVSSRAVAKIIQAFDRLQQRNDKITKTLKGELDEQISLDTLIRDANIQLEQENQRLQALNTSLHEKYHAMSLKMKELQEQLVGQETKGDELNNRVDDLTWELTKIISHNDKLINHIQELSEKYRYLQELYGGAEVRKDEIAQRKMDISEREVKNLQKDNEELKELATNRLAELEKLHHAQKETLRELEKLRMDIRTLPESVIVETTEYKCLQSKFSVIYNDHLQLRSSMDETKQHLFQMRTNHLKQIEQMESEELLVQKKLRTEVIQLEDMLGQVRKEYEMLRIEFEQNLTANEQTGPINREMRHLITSLQNHNQQLKGDVHRYRRKYKDLCSECKKLKRQKQDLESKVYSSLDRDAMENNSSLDGFKDSPDSPTSSVNSMNEIMSPMKGNHDSNLSFDLHEKNDKTNDSTAMKKDPKKENKKAEPSKNKAESECTKELKSQLKKAMNEQKEMKLLLDMYKGLSKDQRDKVQLMASEKKFKAENEELKSTLKKLQDNKKEERKKLADEDAMKKIKSLEDQVHQLTKQVTAQKAEEEALISEMEVTGQAFEDMQEQNSRLIQQLREKDDANFKLMSDRIKNNQLKKFAMEERELLTEQISTLTKQIEAQSQVVRKLEEKERLLLNSIASMEKEASLRQQAMELHKRKAIESAQSAADLKLHLEKYHLQMKDAQSAVAEKTSALEAEAYKTRRLQEEIGSLKRKVERLNKIEMAGNTDEVLMEEIREYKETLTCPSCKVKRKDAVLVKCFHVFCYDCLRTRYETRQRKCPKCNAAFGANDYHRLYLT